MPVAQRITGDSIDRGRKDQLKWDDSDRIFLDLHVLPYVADPALAADRTSR